MTEQTTLPCHDPGNGQSDRFKQIGVKRMKKSIARPRAGRSAVAESVEGVARLRRYVQEQQDRAHELAALLGCMQVAAEDSTTDPQLLGVAQRLAAGISEALGQIAVEPH